MKPLAPLEALDLPLDLVINTRSLAPKPSHDNVLRLLETVGSRISFEGFQGVIVCAGLSALGLRDGEWSDQHTTELVALLESKGLDVAAATVQRAIEAHAHRHKYNALTRYAEECAEAWDGAPRVDRALTTYWGATDTPATRAAARVFFLSLAARAGLPGSKVDTCLLLIGKQGCGKSRSLRAVVGDAWFSDTPPAVGEKDGMQDLRGKWLIEFAENAGTSKKDRNAVKAYLGKSEDNYRPSYGRNSVRVPRQTCFAITTNDPEILSDPTGNRRFMPVWVGEHVDVAAIERDHKQLIGEAAARWDKGEDWWPTKDEAEALARASEDATTHDAWVDLLAPWVEKQKGPFLITDVFSPGRERASGEAEDAGPIPTPVERLSPQLQSRAKDLLRHKLGLVSWKYKRRQPSRLRDAWVWGRPEWK